MPTFEPTPDRIITGRFEPFDTERPLALGTVGRREHGYLSPGVVRFEHDGTPYELQVIVSAGRHTTVFADGTSGDTTYPAGRALDIPAPAEDGTVTLDFNRAINLPCAPPARPAPRVEDHAGAGLRRPELEIVWNTEVTEILGEHAVEGVGLRDTVTGETRRLDVSGLFIAIGHEPRSELFQRQVDIDENGYVRVSHPKTATDRPGVFAAGDLVDHRYRQAITAAGTGAAAALHAERHLAALRVVGGDDRGRTGPSSRTGSCTAGTPRGSRRSRTPWR